MQDNLVFAREHDLDVGAFIDVLHRSGLAERRPADGETLAAMCRNASIIMTCRCEADGRLVGIARSISDFVFCTYLSDLAVDRAYQRRGIGTRLITATRDVVGPVASLILLAAPAAESYYKSIGPSIGLERHPSGWLIRRQG
jgi:GNAT superfamily N-acetyltransferase